MSIADVVRQLSKLEEQEIICILTRHEETEDAQRNKLDSQSPVVRMVGKLSYLNSNIYMVLAGKYEMRFSCHMVEHIRAPIAPNPAIVFISWLE